MTEAANVKTHPVSHDLPKAEMHTHISLALSPSDFRDRVEQGRTDLGFGFIQERNARYYPDLFHFHSTYERMRNLTRNGEELAHVTQTYLETIADQGAIYAEVSNSFREGADFDAQMEAVAEGISHAQERTGIEARIVVTTLRDRGYEFAELAAKTLAKKSFNKVAAFGLVGDELCDSLADYKQALDIAFHEAGLGLAPHVAEQDVRNAIDFLDIVPKDIVEAAEDDHRRLRVGHGSLIHVSSELLQAYAERKICLEVCLSANNRIGLPHDTRELEIGQKVANQNGTSVTADNKLQDYFNSLADHPLPIFEERGIPVVLGSDNPLLLNTNIAKEYSLAVAKAGYAGDPLEFTETAVEYANVDWETRESLRRQIAKYEMLRH